MAIVFNSDAGTISGLSVGGLPDGVVDADTLASNSVNAAKIIDGTIVDSEVTSLAASKLTGALPAISGASLTGLTSAQMPTGSVLQVVYGTPRASNTSTTTSGSWTNGGVSVNITPSSTSSKILVLQTLLGSATNSNAYTRSLYTLQRSIGGGAYSDVTPMTSTDGGGNVYGGVEIGTYGGATELLGAATFNHLDSPNTTSECTYLVYIRALGGYGTARLQKGSVIMAMEIAG